MYVVYVESWNCSCAAFAFAAFPAFLGGVPWRLDGDEGGHEHYGMEGEGCGGGEGEKEEEEEWEFGGLSLDGREGEGGLPVCKHLLACVLGEKWEDVLGSYVKEKVVSREEMAGYAAE